MFIINYSDRIEHKSEKSYEELRSLYDDLQKICKKHNITIFTSTNTFKNHDVEFHNIMKEEKNEDKN